MVYKFIDIILSKLFKTWRAIQKKIKKGDSSFTNTGWENISVIIIPVIKKDILVLKKSISSIRENLDYLGEIHLIIKNEEKDYFNNFLKYGVKLISEETILNVDERKLRGWLKQQILKIKYASLLDEFDYVMWMDSDLVWIKAEFLFDLNKQPIFRYSDENHIIYKRGIQRLGVKVSYLKSFITHYMVVEPEYCKMLIEKIGGFQNLANTISKAETENFGMFSEYDLYANFRINQVHKPTLLQWNIKNSKFNKLAHYETLAEKYSKDGFVAIAFHNYV